jgi:hemoglobin
VCLTGTAPAAEDKPAAPLDRPELDRRCHHLLTDVIDRGAEMYNGGNPAGCCNLWYGSLITLHPLLDHHPDLQKAIEEGMAAADRETNARNRAWVLRPLLDEIRNNAYAGSLTAGAAPAPPPGPPRAPRTGATLWERLGGEENAKRIVDDFVELALKDPKVNFSRGGKYKLTPGQITAMKSEFVDLTSQVSGGRRTYSGKSMKEVHKDMGITDAEFDAALADMRTALAKNGVGPEDVQQLLAAVERTRPSIVEVKTAGTLCERLGGEENVKRIVSDFVDAAVADPKVNFSRGGKYKLDEAATARLKEQFVKLASSVSGGPDNYKYDGKSMKEAHKDMGITDAEFDALTTRSSAATARRRSSSTPWGRRSAAAGRGSRPPRRGRRPGAGSAARSPPFCPGPSGSCGRTGEGPSSACRPIPAFPPRAILAALLTPQVPPKARTASTPSYRRPGGRAVPTCPVRSAGS